jgi:multiubiquitin
METQQEERKEHRNPEKDVEIIVNGTPFGWPKDHEISYDQVVTLDVPDYPEHPEITYSVKYKNGPASKPEGILSPGGSVRVKEKMIFSVSRTGQS